MIRAVMFDLDGTLVDSLDDIAESMDSTLAELGLAPHTRDAYCQFIGDGVRLLAKRALPPDRRDGASVNDCVARMQRIYGERLTRHTRPYPGIAELLAQLTERGVVMAVLSNKRHHLTQRTVDELFQTTHFATVVGQREDVPKKPDPTAARQIANTLRIPTNQWLYVGDTSTDMDTARNAEMIPVGVLWGFRGANELREHGAAHLLDKPADLVDLL